MIWLLAAVALSLLVLWAVCRYRDASTRLDRFLAEDARTNPTRK